MDSRKSHLANVVSDTVRLARQKPRPAKTKPSTSSSSSSGEFKFLDSKVELVNGSSAVSTWTTVDLSAYIPTSCKRVLLECKGRNITSPTGSRTFEIRADASSIQLSVIYTRGTTTSDITAMIAERTVPVSNRSFEYTTSAMSEYVISLIGYWN